MNTPDNWVIIKITTDKETLYKVLAGWVGGYAYGDSWKMNSGITKVEEDGDYYLFHGFSGSTYKCHKDGEGLRGMTGMIFGQLDERFGDNIELVLAKDIDEEYML